MNKISELTHTKTELGPIFRSNIEVLQYFFSVIHEKVSKPCIIAILGYCVKKDLKMPSGEN